MTVKELIRTLRGFSPNDEVFLYSHLSDDYQLIKEVIHDGEDVIVSEFKPEDIR